MKRTAVMLLTFGLLSCSDGTDNQVDNKRNDTLSADHIYMTDGRISSDADRTAPTCDFDRSMNDPKTSRLAKDIYLDKEWDLNNDSEALALLDSLTAKDSSTRSFYFKVVTKTKERSDGYYSEALGLAGYEFVEDHTQAFASYFNNKQCHTSEDLATWADIVIMELSISGTDGHERPVIDDYINKLKYNCKDCPTTQKETIDKFGASLKDKSSKLPHK